MSDSAYYEKYAARAAQGKTHPWKKTPIFETIAAQRTDPQNGAGTRLDDGWWLHTDVEPQFLRDQGSRFARAGGAPRRASGTRRSVGRDGVEEENRSFYPDEEEAHATDDAYKFADYLPAADEDAYAWLGNLHIYVEQTSDRQAAFAAVKKYVYGFEPGTRGKDLDESVLRDLLTELCELPGGLLTRREN